MPCCAARFCVGAGPLGCLLAPSLRLRGNGQKMAKSGGGGGGGGGGSGGLTWVVSCGVVSSCLRVLLFFLITVISFCVPCVCGKSVGWLLDEEETDGWHERGSAVEPLGGGVRGAGRGRRQPGLGLGVGVSRRGACSREGLVRVLETVGKMLVCEQTGRKEPPALAGAGGSVGLFCSRCPPN